VLLAWLDFSTPPAEISHLSYVQGISMPGPSRSWSVVRLVQGTADDASNLERHGACLNQEAHCHSWTYVASPLITPNSSLSHPPSFRGGARSRAAA